MQRLFPGNTFVAPKMPANGKDLVRLVVAEAPGSEEAEAGVPLVGGSGRWFDSMLAKAGIPRDGLTLTNCIQCKPPGNVFPTDADARTYISKEEGNAAVKQCFNNHLAPLLRSRSWRRVDLLGDKPLRLVANKRDGISKWRGSPLTIDLLDRKLRGLATFHPAYIMRDQTMFPVAVNDLLKGLDEPKEFYNPFPSIAEVREFTATRFAFDIECPKYRTLGPTAPAEMVGLCGRSGVAICVPIAGAYIPELQRIFRNAVEAVGHNCIQFDLPKLRDVDIEVGPSCIVYDTMLLQHLLFPDFPHDLEFVGSQFVSKPAWKDDKGVLQVYCCRDTDVTWACFLELLPMVRRQNLLNLYLNVQVPMARICSLMHQTGFKLDPNQIKFVRAKLIKERDGLEKDLPEFLRTRDEPVNRRVLAPEGTLGKTGKPVKYKMVPSSERVIPWRSSGAKQRYLYSKEEGCLGADPIYDLKSGRITTGKIALEKIFNRTKNPAVKALRRLNQLDELITTFAKEDMVKVDRMFPHFNVHGTGSGRLSSSDPNLQNIPESARYIYVPSYTGWKIVDVDYSQIENRLTAFFAGDKERLQRFHDDPKFSEHKYAASLFVGVAYGDVVKDNDKDAPYGKAKRIVHGTNYGMGSLKIAKTFDMDPKETKRLQDLWKGAIKATTLWQMKTGEKAKRDSFLTTPFERKRWFWTSSAYTEALSFLPQSTAADVIFRAMIGLMYQRIGWPVEKVARVARIYEALPEPCRLLLQVHDSLVFECPSGMVDELVRVVRKVMEQPWPELGGMVIPIGVKVGDSWGDTEDYGI